MQTSPQKNNRTVQSRINGAKSRGPKTPRGKERSRTAPLHHGLYAKEPSLPPTVDEPLYAALRQQYQSVWNAADPYLAAKVDDLIAYRWELDRLRAVRRQFLARVFNDVAATHNEKDAENSIVCETEIRANAESGTLDRFDLRIRRCNLEISRIERDIIRVHRFFSASGASQNLLETKEVEPERTRETQDPIAWAEDNFDIALDVHQAELLTAAGPKTILNAARYSGKTTALALRALHDSIAEPEKIIACVSPNGALNNKIAELAAIAGHNPANVTDKLTQAAQLVIVDDAADLQPGALAGLNPQAAVILAATPNGAAGYFYEQWRAAAWTKISAPAGNCDLIDEAFLRQAAAKLKKSMYLQEFQCEFLDVPQPRCRLLPLAQ